MKRSLFWASIKSVVLIMSALACVSTAQAVSVAVVDPVEALSDTKEAKSMLQRFRDEAKEDAEQAKKLKDELRALMDKSKKNADIMTRAQLEKLEKEAEDKQIDYQFVRQKLQKKQQEGREQILELLGPKFETVLDQLIKEGKYELILHRQAVFHTSESIDITAEVTRRIDQIK